jgi:hypothetical protein
MFDLKKGSKSNTNETNEYPGQQEDSKYNLSDTDMSILRPLIPNGSHPIITGRYLIPTSEILKIYEILILWLENKTPGAIVYGRPRIGKTNAITFLIKSLKKNLGESLPVYHILCDQHNKPNENTFFENLLRDIDHGFQLNGSANIKRERLIKYLIHQGEISGHSRIILFMDDAQRLFEIQYGWLMDIYNLLYKYGITLTVILVGQEELMHQKNAFLQAKKAQIIGRFMVCQYKFNGIKSIVDIKICLKSYDTISEFPHDSGWSFTRYYFPNAFAEGIRLESCAEDLFSAFTTLRQEYGIKKPFEIPMEYFTLTINYALRKFGADGSNINWISKNNWYEAIRNSGYIEAEMYQDVICV